MQLFIKTLTGKTLTLEVEGTDTVEDVKLKIEDKEDYHPNAQCLICGGRNMDGGRTLDDCNILGKQVMHPVLRWGPPMCWSHPLHPEHKWAQMWSEPTEGDMDQDGHRNPVAVRSSLLLALSEAVVVPWDAMAIALSMHVITSWSAMGSGCSDHGILGGN